MSQDASNPLNLTTMTNVADAINQALRSKQNLKDILIDLRGLGASPEILKNALGHLADNPQIREAVRLSSGPDYMKSFDSLDPERRAHEIEAWRVMMAVKKSKEWREAEEAAEASETTESKASHERAGKLGSALDKAHTFEEKVHAFEDHFAGGGAIWETAEAMGLSREQAQKIKAREQELDEEWNRKHQGERERVSTELQRRGKSKEEADRMAKEREDAQRQRDNFQRLKDEGAFNGARPELVEAQGKAHTERANKSDMNVTQALAAPERHAVKSEVEAISKAVASGTLTKEQELAMRAAEAAHAKDGLAKLKDDKELEKFMLKATIQRDGSALGKELAAVGVATGAISEKKIGEAKWGEKAGLRDGRGTTASEDEFASLGESAPTVASVDIKGKLASMRNAETPAPASKGPSLA